LAGIGEERHMMIKVHVERLILEGISVTDPDSAVVEAALESEMARRFTRLGNPDELLVGGDRVLLQTSAPRLPSSTNAKALGTQVGARVHDAITAPEYQE
jgi:hypothetical protein